MFRATALALLILAAVAPAASAKQERISLQAIANARGDTWRCQDARNHPRTRAERTVNSLRVAGQPYRAWVARRWNTRATACKAALRREVAARKALENMSPQAAICSVFPNCSEALAVARCESNFYTGAQNGQYLGIWQMGDYARSRYGHSHTALGQTRAAYAYFREAGWSPWECASILGIR